MDPRDVAPDQRYVLGDAAAILDRTKITLKRWHEKKHIKLHRDPSGRYWMWGHEIRKILDAPPDTLTAEVTLEQAARLDARSAA